ncbi:sarcosine oxidase subunit gamma [Rhodobacteraceae bacterium 2CG4]|uniref:Sarcosine oxidase subunit gamma n=1 Tax=Halovulum marinum TaxID=2662447 RepID=A0A6L5YWF0_9RHOB|nr:sarcosine oxidase subunit gamma [Halovulum marinum]MSU88646.1 sarcosine oxidase subunit gamma [Halovulum marinum]
MPELDATPPVGFAPCRYGQAALAPMPWVRITSAVPLASAGHDLPPPGMSAILGGARVLWMGRALWFVLGAAPDLPGMALSDQSDGWAGFRLTGAGTRAVLARLCPLDLHPAVFPEGATARSELAHMAASITAEADGYLILVMRSFAGTALDELETAMRSVAAQDAIGG